MKMIDLEQGSPEWHEWRSGGIGASNVASIIAWPYAHESARHLWMQRTGRKPRPDLSNNFFVRRGHEQEPLARAAFEHWLWVAKGIKDQAKAQCVEHDQIPYIRVSLDGLLSDGTPVEMKVPAWETFEKVLKERRNSEAFKRYYPQVQDQMLVTGAKSAYLVFYRACDRKLIVFVINRDEEMIADLYEKQAWWWDLLEKDQAPPITELDYFEPETPELQQEWTDIASELNSIWQDMSSVSQKVKEGKAKEAELKKKMRSLMGNHEKGEYAGVRISATARQGSVNYKKWIDEINTLYPTIHLPDLEDYRNASSESIRVNPVKYIGDGVSEILNVDFY